MEHDSEEMTSDAGFMLDLTKWTHGHEIGVGP